MRVRPTVRASLPTYDRTIRAGCPRTTQVVCSWSLRWESVGGNHFAGRELSLPPTSFGQNRRGGESDVPFHRLPVLIGYVDIKLASMSSNVLVDVRIRPQTSFALLW